MKTLLRLEEAAMTLAAFYFIAQLHLPISWWLYPILFFLPDIGMLGYLAGNKPGAITYNLTHHKAVAIAVGFTGIICCNEWLVFAGLILFAHSSFDRILGYGLKTFEGFKFTHLGQL